MLLPPVGLPGFKCGQSASFWAVRPTNGLNFPGGQLCRELPARLAVCRAPLYKEVMHALVGRMHLRKGLAESQLLALPCTVVASHNSKYFHHQLRRVSFFFHSQCLGIPLQLSKNKHIRVRGCQLYQQVLGWSSCTPIQSERRCCSTPCNIMIIWHHLRRRRQAILPQLHQYIQHQDLHNGSTWLT